MARGDGSIIGKPGTKKLYIKYYIDGPGGRRTQTEEATHSEDRGVAEKMLRERLGGADPVASTSGSDSPYLLDIPTVARKLNTTVFAI
jgi:hypothetical protein